MGSRHPDKKVYVIFSSVDAEDSASNLTNDTAEVRVQVLLEVGFDQSAALLGAEYEMDQEVGGCVWHRFLSTLGLAVISRF